MITAKETYNKQEMLLWFLDNTQTEINLFLRNEYGHVVPTQMTALNAPEFLHIVLSNLFFETTKKRCVMIYHIHGGKFHTTFVFPKKINYYDWPAFFHLVEETKPLKSVKCTWPMDQSPFNFLPGVDAE